MVASPNRISTLAVAGLAGQLLSPKFSASIPTAGLLAFFVSPLSRESHA